MHIPFLTPAPIPPKERRLYGAFRVGLYIKGFDGLLQTAGGIFLLFVAPTTLSRWLILLTQQELFDDPQDFIALHLHQLAIHLSLGGTLFAAFYLIAHGAVKIFIAVEVLRDRHWAYKPSFIALCVLIAYQVYRIGHTHSLLLLAFTAFDVFIAALIWHEYRYHVRTKHRPDPNA
jgi:uncharacterized membrane protein